MNVTAQHRRVRILQQRRRGGGGAPVATLGNLYMGIVLQFHQLD